MPKASATLYPHFPQRVKDSFRERQVGAHFALSMISGFRAPRGAPRRAYRCSVRPGYIGSPVPGVPGRHRAVGRSRAGGPPLRGSRAQSTPRTCVTGVQRVRRSVPPWRTCSRTTGSARAGTRCSASRACHASRTRRCTARSSRCPARSSASGPTCSPAPSSTRASRSRSRAWSARSRSTSCRASSRTPSGRWSNPVCSNGSGRSRRSSPTSTAPARSSPTAWCRAGSW